MNNVDKQYIDLLSDILTSGCVKKNRTGIDTIAVFGRMLRFNLSEGFPVLTTKKVHWKSVVHELLWFLRGETNIKYLKENGVRIWDEWADESGNLGPVYGSQWRNWTGFDRDNGKAKVVDQIKQLISDIKSDPTSRRLLVTAWNPADVGVSRLPPCHIMHHYFVDACDRLSCLFYMRSCDVFLGLPFNIASYALLTSMIAHICGLKVGELVWSGGDVHLYTNHIEQVKTQLTRKGHELPTLRLNENVVDIDDFQYQHIELQNYVSDPAIPAPVAV